MAFVFRIVNLFQWPEGAGGPVSGVRLLAQCEVAC